MQAPRCTQKLVGWHPTWESICLILSSCKYCLRQSPNLAEPGRGMRVLMPRAVAGTDADMPSAWSVGGCYDDCFVIFSISSRVAGDSKATVLPPSLPDCGAWGPSC